MKIDKITSRNYRNEILKRKFDEPKAETEVTSRLPRLKRKPRIIVRKFYRTALIRDDEYDEKIFELFISTGLRVVHGL